MRLPMPRVAAEAAAERVCAYWAERGYAVKAQVLIEGAHESAPIYALRTDMLNGLPRGFVARVPEDFASLIPTYPARA